MSRLQLKLAILISVVLIGGATANRLINSTKEASNLIALKNTGSVQNNDTSLQDISPAYSTSTPSSIKTETLTQTDLIGRQLFSDYLSLSSSGQATDDNINALAGSYAENLSNLSTIADISTDKITPEEDTVDNLSAYGDSVIAIHTKYQNLASALSTKGVSDIKSVAFVSFANSMSSLYSRAASELLLLKVPASLVENHVALVNNYLSSADAAKTLSTISKDPAGAYSALVTQQKNSQEEIALFENIHRTLMSNGIITNSGT